MRTLKLICLSLLAVAGGLAGASGQSSPTNINPALLYYQAFLMAPDPLREAEWDYLGSVEGRSRPLPSRFEKIVEGYDNQFKLVRLAAHSAVPCDWGCDMSAGPRMLLPQLARVKAVAVASRIRVTWELQHGRQADAGEDMLAVLTLARNASRDGVLIPTLVQFACEAILCNIVAENFWQFSPETLQQLVDGMEQSPAQGMVTAAVAAEDRICREWEVRKIMEFRQQYPSDDAKVMAALQELYDDRGGTGEGQPGQAKPSLWEQVSKAAGGTSDGLINLLQERKQFNQRFAAIAALPYAEYENQVKLFKAEIDAEIEKSPNPLVSLDLPAWERSRQKEFRVQTCLAMVRAAVEYKLHGEPGLQSVTDPCGQGPFAFRRFILQGVDRGFELKSAYSPDSFPWVLIFVEKEGPPFFVDGPYAGQVRH
jgi:hypothetical protein